MLLPDIYIVINAQHNIHNCDIYPSCDSCTVPFFNNYYNNIIMLR